ncbi:acylphosphatase [Kiloniella laminariae]|uniref:acylphosphatase n=1 Tax=Kiloniella laminariae TaxID=454162 RepID=A0ABT4LPD9_9PROT|nr:acylphosphatase [Kiloniella laminariae]MCZ4282978.1 acylphosphatase [Kiloniella laminariae]
MSKQIRVLISGRVQGVWYRRWTVNTASALGLSGWVRNLASGQVEAVFCGEDDIVDQMLLACQTGPELAHVTAIVTEPDSSQLSADKTFSKLEDG